MKKIMKKRLLSILLAAAMLVTMTGFSAYATAGEEAGTDGKAEAGRTDISGEEMPGNGSEQGPVKEEGGENALIPADVMNTGNEAVPTDVWNEGNKPASADKTGTADEGTPADKTETGNGTTPADKSEAGNGTTPADKSEAGDGTTPADISGTGDAATPEFPLGTENPSNETNVSGVQNATALPSAEPASCICEEMCTEEFINEDCPVCGAEGADLEECLGIQGVPMLFSINDQFEVDGITYKEVGAGKVRLMSGKNYSGNLQIPEWVTKPGTGEQYQVVSIEGWAFATNSSLTGISFPDSITYIGGYAFSSCSGLTGELVLPAGLTCIEDRAFYMCSGLTGELKLPDGLEYIGESAFYKCDGFSGKLAIPNGVTSVGQDAFGFCKGFSGDLVLPESLESIGMYAFRYCTGLGSSLVLPGGLTKIDKNAFDGCAGFSGSVVLPDSLCEIGASAFKNCGIECTATQESVARMAYLSGCSNITLNGEAYSYSGTTSAVVNGLKYEVIDESKGYARVGSYSATGRITIPATVVIDGKNYQVTEIGDNAFLNSSITGVTFSEGLLRIGKSAFDGCKKLNGTLNLPKSLTEIGEAAFSQCTALRGLKLPDGLTVIGDKAFYECTGFTGKLILPKGLQEVKYQAFYNCSGFTGGLALPEGLKKIGGGAFYNCCKLSGILQIPDSVTHVGAQAFQVCSGFSQFHVGKGVEKIGKSAFPTGANVSTDSPRVQLLLVEYTGDYRIPTAYWNGTEDVPGGAIVTVKQDITVAGDYTIGPEAKVTIAPDVTVTVDGSLRIEGTVKVDGTLISNGTIEVVQKGEIIRRQQQALTVSDVGTKTYGDDSFSLTASGGSGQGAITFESADPSVLTISGETASIHKAGTVTVTATKAQDYTFQPVSATLEITIEKKEITIQAGQITVKKDEEMPQLTYEPIGLAYQDKVEKEPIFSCETQDTGTMGEYTITIDGAVLTNHDSYIIHYLPGMLKVVDNLYLLRVNNSGDGITAEGEYRPGNQIPVHAGVYEGYIFEGWTSDNGGAFADAASADTIFTMPRGDVTITANWKKESVTPGGDDKPGEGDTPGGDDKPGEGDTPGGDDTPGGNDTPGGDGGSSSGGSGGGSSGGSGGSSSGGSGNGSAGGNGGNPAAGGGNITGQMPFSADKNGLEKPTDAVSGTVSVNAQIVKTENNSAVVDITADHISQGIRAAQEEAARRGVKAGSISIIIHVSSGEDKGTGDGMDTAGTITLNLPQSVQKRVVEQKIQRIAFAFDEQGISVGMDLAAMAAVKKQARGDAHLVVKKEDGALLSPEGKTAVGNRPLFSLEVLYDNGVRKIEDFGKGNISVAIPYTLQKGEEAGGVTAVYVDGSGKAQYLLRSVYDEDGKILRFATNHFSMYGIGYRAPVFYKDIKGSWAKGDIAFISSRGLIDGRKENMFSPDDGITRGEFAAALARLTGGNPGEGKEKDFSDAVLSRQEAAVLLSDYADEAGIALIPARGENAFADNDSIADYARDEVKRMQMAGVVNGKDGYRFDPAGKLTRGEACNLLRHYMERAIEPATAQGWTKNASGHWLCYRDGRKLTGWQTVDGLRYRFGEDGTLAVGIKVGEK